MPDIKGDPQRHQPQAAATVDREPKRADTRRGGRFGQHVLPDRADDLRVEQLVRVVFNPQPMFPGLPCKNPCDPVLVQQLLDHAPQTDRTGVNDWDRPLRADEVAEIYGTPMEGDPLDVRIAWLRRADELCRAWGTPLAGPGGLVPTMTLPATGDTNQTAGEPRRERETANWTFEVDGVLRGPAMTQEQAEDAWAKLAAEGYDVAVVNLRHQDNPS